MRPEYTPLLLITTFNLVALIYWFYTWVKSYTKYRDTVSRLVLVFIFQNLFNAIWTITVASHAVLGGLMGWIMLYGNVLNQVVILVSLGYVHLSVVRMRNEETENDD